MIRRGTSTLISNYAAYNSNSPVCGEWALSETCQGQQRAAGMWSLSTVIVHEERGKGSSVGSLEDSWGAVEASEVPGDVPHKCCLCQFEGINLIILSGFLFPLDRTKSEEKGCTYKFHCRSKSPSFPHFGELIFLYMEYLGFLQALCS